VRRSPVLLVAALLLAGCGTASSSKNFAGEQATVAKVIDNLSTYGTGHQAADICNKIFAPTIAAKLKAAGGSCDSVVTEALKNVDIFVLTVQAVKITGNTAVVTVKSTSNGKNVVQALDLVHAADGTWRLSSFG
jgi:uncharacterized protein YceK